MLSVIYNAELCGGGQVMTMLRLKYLGCGFQFISLVITIKETILFLNCGGRPCTRAAWDLLSKNSATPLTPCMAFYYILLNILLYPPESFIISS